MAGVSIAYFTPSDVVAGVERFIKGCVHTIGPAKLAWPLEVRSIEGTPLSYAKVDSYIPLHIDPPGDSQGRVETNMFHFVFEAVNRPVLLVGEASTFEGECTDERTALAVQRTKAMLLGADALQLRAFNIGAIELVPGMAVHFDIAENWHGITAAPMPMRSIGVRMDPKLLIVQMGGFEATELSEAIKHMATLLALDAAWWTSGRREKNFGKDRK